MCRKKSDSQSQQFSFHIQKVTPQTSLKCPGKSPTAWPLLAPRGSREALREARAFGASVSRCWQLSADAQRIIDLTCLPLQLHERVCFTGGGEVMLSKWAKILGSSSSSSSPSSWAECARLAAWARVFVCVRACARAPLSQPLLSLSHSAEVLHLLPSCLYLSVKSLFGQRIFSAFVYTTRHKLFCGRGWRSVCSPDMRIC